MIAKKMTAFRFSGEMEAIASGINAYPFAEILGGDSESVGFVPVAESEASCAAVFGSLLCFKVRTDSKRVPGSAVRSELDRRVARIEQTEGYKPGRKQQREMKEQIVSEFLLKAIPSVSFLDGWFDFKTNLLVVADSSSSKVERIVTLLYKNCPSLVFRPVKTQESPSSVMTSWVQGEEPPVGVCLDDRAKFEFPSGGKASVSALSITDSHVSQLTDAKAVAVELGLTLKDSWITVVTESLVIKSLKHIDIQSQRTNSEDESYQSDAFINANAAAAMIDLLCGAFGSEVVCEDLALAA